MSENTGHDDTGHDDSDRLDGGIPDEALPEDLQPTEDNPLADPDQDPTGSGGDDTDPGVAAPEESADPGAGQA